MQDRGVKNIGLLVTNRLKYLEDALTRAFPEKPLFLTVFFILLLIVNDLEVNVISMSLQVPLLGGFDILENNKY